jgi:hypothetical protein
VKQQHGRRLSLMVFFLLFALLLSACGGSVKNDLTLFGGDRLDLSFRLSLSAADLSAEGGAGAIESQLKQIQQQAQAQGAKFSWRREDAQRAGEIAYRVTVGGASYEELVSTYNININIQKTKYQGHDALSISAGPNGMADVENPLRVHVGKILQTDNQRSGNNTIVWDGTDHLDAIVTPASRTNWPVILLVILAVAALAACVFVFLRRRPASKVAPNTTSAAPAARWGFCPHCGQPMQPGAKFCMDCGQVVPPPPG